MSSIIRKMDFFAFHQKTRVFLTFAPFFAIYFKNQKLYSHYATSKICTES